MFLLPFFAMDIAVLFLLSLCTGFRLLGLGVDVCLVGSKWGAIAKNRSVPRLHPCLIPTKGGGRLRTRDVFVVHRVS